MRNSYIGFYNPSEKEIKDAWDSSKTLFIFDTNVLLNLYSYKEETKNDFFSVLDKLKKKIWLPFHVGLEYQFNRINVIKNQKEIFNKLINKLDKLKEIKSELEQLHKKHPEIEEKTDLFIKDLSELVDGYKKEIKSLDKSQPCVRSHDKIREKLNDLFENKIGKELPKEDIEKIESEGEYRYEHLIPPGFKDNEKKDYIIYNNIRYKRKYGDLIIWKQILEKSEEENIENIIFITDDVKSDWWFSIDSNGKKIIGPHAHLINEIRNNIKIFHMYETSSFLDDASKKLKENIEISENSIKDMIEVQRNNELLYKTTDEIANFNKTYLEILAKKRSDYDEQIKKLDKINSVPLEKYFKYSINIKDNFDKLNKISNLHKMIEEIEESENLKKEKLNALSSYYDLIKKLDSINLLRRYFEHLNRDEDEDEDEDE